MNKERRGESSISMSQPDNSQGRDHFSVRGGDYFVIVPDLKNGLYYKHVTILIYNQSHRGLYCKLDYDLN